VSPVGIFAITGHGIEPFDPTMLNETDPDG
jgi:hypothetical protein